MTIVPDIGPGDVVGWETLARRSTTDAGREDDADLSVTVTESMLTEVEFSCRGTSDTWLVISYLDGVGGYVPCMESAQPVAYPAELVPNEVEEEGETLGEVRMFLTEPGQVNCWDTPTVATPREFDACVAAYETLAEVPEGVTAELVVWGHPDPPTVARILASDYGALGILEGTEYVLDRAILSAPGCRHHDSRARTCRRHPAGVRPSRPRGGGAARRAAATSIAATHHHHRVGRTLCLRRRGGGPRGVGRRRHELRTNASPS